MRPGFQSSSRTYCNPIIEIHQRLTITYQSFSKIAKHRREQGSADIFAHCHCLESSNADESRSAGRSLDIGDFHQRVR